MVNVLEAALRYQQLGFAVYPLAPMTRTPLKGSHGYKDATKDPEQAKAWWGPHPEYNIGIGLDGVLVFDIDMGHKSEANGNESLAKLSADGRADQIPSTYIEATPSGGLHMFFTYPKELQLTSRSDLFATNGKKTGLDYIATGVPVFPSVRSNGMYQPLKGHKITNLAPAPQWLLDEIQCHNRLNMSDYHNSPDSWFGHFIDRLVSGADEGNRNQWLTSIVGSVFRSGADPDNCVDLIQTINRCYVRPPLPNRELVKIIKSISKRELARRE